MRKIPATVCASATALLVFSCAIEDEDRCGDDYVWIDGGCYEKDTGSGDTDTDTDTDTGSDTTEDGGPDYDPAQWIGSSCTCEGDECSNMGTPVPNGGTIIDCDDVPADWAGADKVCLRSYGGDLGPKSYYANGYCSLVATSCVGDGLICSSAVMGDFENMAACPPGTAMITSATEVAVMNYSATITGKTCTLLCDSDGDCRNSETDPELDGETTQYQCVEKEGVKFCQDPRNLSEDYTVQAF